MTLLEKLKEKFFARTLEIRKSSPSVFDRLRNIFFSAEFLANDLERIPAECKCEDAIAHLDGRCTSCATASGKTDKAMAPPRRGCSAQIERLQVGIRDVREALKQRRAALQPEEETAELRDELALIENLVECLASALERLMQDVTEFQGTCSNDVLRRLKQASGELRVYTGDFFRTINVKDVPTRAAAPNQLSRVGDIEQSVFQRDAREAVAIGHR